MGVDYTLKGLISVRAGYVSNHDIAGLSFGMGILPQLMGSRTEFSYSYSSMNTFDDVSRISIKLGL